MLLPFNQSGENQGENEVLIPLPPKGRRAGRDVILLYPLNFMPGVELLIVKRRTFNVPWAPRCARAWHYGVLYSCE